MQKLSGKTFSIYWQHSKKYPWKLFVIVLGMAIALFTELYAPFLYKNFFNILTQASGQISDYISLRNILVFILIINLINWIAYRTSHFFTNAFEVLVSQDLMTTCFNYLHQHSYNFFTNNFAGSLQRKVNRYPKSFENITDLLIWEALPNFFRVAFIIFILILKYWTLGLAVLIWAIVHTLFNYAFTQYKLNFDLKKSQTDTELSGLLADTIANNINIKVFSNLKLESSGFKKLTQKWTDLTKKTYDLDAFSLLIQNFLMVLIEFLVFYFALRYWRVGKFSVGDFVFMQAYVVMAFHNTWNVSRHLKKFYENMADANEMTEILTQKLEVPDLGTKRLSVKKGEIEFKKASYSYNKEIAIFRDFDLKIEAGEKVAIIGPSGGGKSTLVKLLLRFYDLTNGKITVDNQDISKVTQDSLRENIALVPQDPILFHRTIMENIRYSKPEASDEEVIEAARLAHCHEFISKLQLKYETFVGERGVKLSGGERQRVAIARAILKNAPVLVLDEATSSLDSESERLIQDALKNLMTNKTAIVIAHRLSTVMQMDRIVVIENGKIVEQGKHKELLKLTQGSYQKLWNIQAGGFTK
jgi:ATP-binding cassette subfamily B protein